MPSADISNILSRLDPPPTYITQETNGVSGHIKPSDYIANGDAQEFNYVSLLKTAFSGDGASISQLRDLGNQSGQSAFERLENVLLKVHIDWLPGDKANVFVANHDTER